MSKAKPNINHSWHSKKLPFVYLPNLIELAGPQCNIADQKHRDENDLAMHIDYIHYNPVKHGLVNSFSAWPHSGFHRYVKQGDYDADWGAGCKIEFDAKVRYE